MRNIEEAIKCIVFRVILVARCRINNQTIVRVSLLGRFVFLISFKEHLLKMETLDIIKRNNSSVVFLKANKRESYSIRCIQHWIDVADNLGYAVCIICDNSLLEADILKSITFKSNKVVITKSYRHYANIHCFFSGHWKRTTEAHLTPFYICNNSDVINHWDIDADDTMICLSASRVAELMRSVENKANNESVDIFSLDMWLSRTGGKHWSLGVVYVSKGKNVSKHLLAVNSDKWKKEYEIIDDELNLDWYFTYLRNIGKFVIKSFYVDNMFFIHWGNFIEQPIYSSIYYWNGEKLEFPLLSTFVPEISNINIVADKIQLNLNNEESLKFVYEDVMQIQSYSKLKRQMYNII